jgi:hypothetical protein
MIWREFDNEDHGLVKLLGTIWPGYVFEEGRKAVVFAAFKRFSTQEVYEAALAWAADNLDKFPEWEQIKRRLTDKGKKRYDPSAWGPVDEHSLAMLRRMYWTIYRKKGLLLPYRWFNETEFIRHYCGKNPTEQERQEAQAILNRHLQEAEDRGNSRGRPCKFVRYPDNFWMEVSSESVSTENGSVCDRQGTLNLERIGNEQSQEGLF